MINILIPGVIALALLMLPSQAEARDGVLFDQGAEMTAPAERASEATGTMAYLLGSWAVKTTFHEESGDREVPGDAVTTFMNRGHGYLERFACDDFDGQGNGLHTASLLVHVPSTGRWNLGLVDSWSESATVYSGGADGDGLVLETIDRRGGSGPLVVRRITIGALDGGPFTVRAESGEAGGALAPQWTRRYERKAEVAAPFAGSGVGEAAPGMPEEASQFDFLLGEWDLQHQMTFPNGQVGQWPARGTAVRILGGHAILESNWYDVDPSVPDAATTIIRIYNRAMRQWESLFCTNRFNNILHFGGVQEGDEIVLHSFDTDSAQPQFSYWVFHGIETDRYGWFANTSKDRGETFEKTWIIEGVRRR